MEIEQESNGMKLPEQNDLDSLDRIPAAPAIDHEMVVDVFVSDVMANFPELRTTQNYPRFRQLADELKKKLA